MLYPFTIILLLLLIHSKDITAQSEESLLQASSSAASESWESGFENVIKNNLCENGVLLWPGAPLAAGTNEIASLMVNSVEIQKIKITWQALGAELSPDTMLGYTWGVLAAQESSSGTIPQIGRYISAWIHENGKWKISAFLINGIRASGPYSGIPFKHKPLDPQGPAGEFIREDLEFAEFAAENDAEAAFRKWASGEVRMFRGDGIIVSGSEAVAGLVRGKAEWTWYPVAAGSSNDGNLGWTSGEAVISPLDSDPVYTKYLTIWEKDTGGKIKFLMDGGNLRLLPE